jgi:hypothetical protein
MFGGGEKLWSKGEKRQALGYQAFSQKRAELLNKQAGKEIDKSFADTLAQSQRGAERARAAVMNMGQGQMGQAMASMAGRGLSGTTVQDNLARSVRSDTANQLGGLEAALAERYGGISAARGQAKAATLGSLAAMYPQFAQMRTQTLQAPTKSKTNMLGAVLGAVGGKFLGSLSGGLGEGLASNWTGGGGK